MTLSPFSNTKLGLDKWLKYCELMILGLSIRQCATEIEVGVKTSFYMRHRILDVINLSLRKDIVDGIVEVDEVFVRHSYKGNHSKSTTFKMPREPRKRAKGINDKKKRGISCEFLQLSKKNKNRGRIKNMLINVATKETCITRNAIRNRFIELT